MKRLILPALIVFFGIRASAADKWVQIQSRNYTLVGNATEGQIREVAEGLEVFRTVFSRFFKLKEGSSVGTTVVVFRSDQAFKPFKPLYKGKAANVAGYFQGGADMNLIALAADMQTPRVIYHELVHRFMSDNMGTLPPWFQEGFAECFSTLEIEGKDKKVRLGRAIVEHVELLNERVFMPLERLFAVQHGSPEYNEESKQGVFYAESWAFVHYMMFNSAERRTQFNQFLDQINNGKPAAQAFQSVFGTDVPTFQKTFEAYIQQRMAWNAFELQTPQGLDRSKDVKSRVLSEGEAEFYLGDLLMRLDRVADAESHLKKALQAEPKNGSIQAGMGRFLLEQKKPEEAVPYMKKAAELDPGNYLMHYYYADALSASRATTSSADRDTLRQELQKTIELSPGFVEATVMLANENLTRNLDMPQTVELLNKAIAIAPGRDFLYLELVNALSRTQPDSARVLAQNLLVSPGFDAGMRQGVQSVVDYLDRVAAAGARASLANRGNADTRPRVEIPRDAQPAEPDKLINEAAPELRRAPAETAARVPEPTIRDAAPQLLTASNTLLIRGMLTLLDCRDGLTLSVVKNGKTAKLHSSNPNAIKFTTFNPAVNGTVSCGPVAGSGVPVEVVYKPSSSDDIVGEPFAVEFIDPSTPIASQRAPISARSGASLVTGLVTLLECSKGVTLTMTVNGQSSRFRNDKPGAVTILNGPNADGTVDCGPMPGKGLNASIEFKPSNDPEALPELLTVQFE